MKVGFVGLGNMGSAMARNLIKAGHTLTVQNHTHSKAKGFEGSATVVRTPGEAAAGAEVLITMVADDRAVEDVVFAKGGVLDSLPKGSIHIAMSTMSVAMSHRLVTAHRERNQHYVAAPVFGRPDAAAAGKLAIAAAGPDDQINRCESIFSALGQKTFVVGDDPPAASLVKVTANFLITTTIESLGEAFALIRKSGVDPAKFLDVLTGSLFAAPIYKTYGGMIAANNFEPVGFSMKLGMKDNRLVLAAAEHAAVPLPMASLIRDRMLTATAKGMGEADWSAIAKISFEEAGL
jgi:3-hydroxyisobutyrate dehydrogenase-like beta-hydroxyacid dehydrogenase